MLRILTTILLFSPLFCFGQFFLKPTAEYSVNTFETNGMNQFVSTFNNFWGSKLSSPYQEFNGKEFSHMNYGGSLYFLTPGDAGITMGSGFLIGKSRYNHSCIWTGGVQNELAFAVRDVMWTFNLGFHVKTRLFIEGYFDANIRKVEMEHATIYQDGSRSLSSEYKLNGFYNGRVSSLNYGAQLGLRFGNFLLYTRPSWAMALEAFGKDLVTVQDYNSNNYPPNDFPADYELYATDPIAFVSQDKGVKIDDFEKFRIAFGIELLIGKFED